MPSPRTLPSPGNPLARVCELRQTGAPGRLGLGDGSAPSLYIGSLTRRIGSCQLVRLSFGELHRLRVTRNPQLPRAPAGRAVIDNGALPP